MGCWLTAYLAWDMAVGFWGVSDYSKGVRGDGALSLVEETFEKFVEDAVGVKALPVERVCGHGHSKLPWRWLRVSLLRCT